MGCDIHLYIEYRDKKSEHDFNDFGGRINPGRNYYMFGLLAKGVRSDNPKGVEPKGIPDKLGYASRNDNQMYISDTEGDGHVNIETADRWIKQGSSVYTDERKVFVTHPDWHSHSWLNTEEYRAALNTYSEHPNSGNYREPEYMATLAVMEKFESMGYDARIVFWFDN